MGLMDRVKQQASALAQQANESMSKLDNLPAQRRADALLRSLGVAVLAGKTGRATGDSEEQVTKILADIAQHEQQYNVDLVAQAAQAAAQAVQAQQPWQPGQPGQPVSRGSRVSPVSPVSPAVSPVSPVRGGSSRPVTSSPARLPLARTCRRQPGPGGAPGYGAPGYGGPGAGGAPGYGGQPMSGPQGWGQQGIGQQDGPAFPPAASFPQAAPAPGPDAEDESGQQGQNFFPPAAGV